MEPNPNGTDAAVILRRASRYLAALPPSISGSNGHAACFRAALALAKGFALHPDDALRLLATEFNPRCAPPWSEAELRHKIRSAMASRAQTGYSLSPFGAPAAASPAMGIGQPFAPIAPPTKPTLNPDLLREIAGGLAADENWLWERSPVPPCVGPADYLDHIAQPGNKLLCFRRYRSQGQHIHVAKALDAEQKTAAFDKWRNGLANGAWFLPQPITGEWLNVERLRTETNPAGRSRRAEESVKSFPYIVMESDNAPPGTWVSALAKLPLPVVSLTWSGGRSIHALLRVNAASAGEWRERVAAIRTPLLLLGADPAALTPVRLTRLPNVHRGERLQRLLYLNPDADGTPICNLPTQPF